MRQFIVDHLRKKSVECGHVYGWLDQIYQNGRNIEAPRWLETGERNGVYDSVITKQQDAVSLESIFAIKTTC